MTSPDKHRRDQVAQALFVQRLDKDRGDPNKPTNATWVAQDALRDADAFVAAIADHDRCMAAKPAGLPQNLRDAAQRAGIPLQEPDDDLA